MKIGTGGRVLKAGGAVALAGLCVTGVATGIACPILMGAAGTLAFSAMRRKGAATCPVCPPDEACVTLVTDSAARDTYLKT
jgi:hypothetical protein